MGRKKHIEHLKDFKKRLCQEIPVDKIILFGSRVGNRASRWSDFDLIIVSKKFRGVNSLKRSLGFHKYWKLDYPVDFLCYTPEEFNRLKKQISIVSEAVRKGIEV